MKNSKDLWFYADNKLVKENIESKRMMRFLYEKPLGKFFGFFITRRWFSKLIGVLKSSSFSKKDIKKFVNKHNIDMSDFERDIESFKSFNDFFTRKLKPGARSIDSNSDVIVSPCDGKLLVIENLKQEDRFLVKNKKFNLKSFLRDNDLALEYDGGVLMIFRLAPYDYHRFHFPFDCIAKKYKRIKGKYHSVHPFAYNSDVCPLIENERHLISLENRDLSSVLMIPVGALCVGKIVETYTPNIENHKADEAGYFAFGGSTVVLLFKKGAICIEDKFVKHSAEGFETKVKMGEPVAYIKC